MILWEFQELWCLVKFIKERFGINCERRNVKKTFVATGFPEQRSKFLFRVSDGEDGMKIEGRNGNYKEKSSIHAKYISRPQSIEHMCLAQFAMMYEKSRVMLPPTTKMLQM